MPSAWTDIRIREWTAVAPPSAPKAVAPAAAPLPTHWGPWAAAAPAEEEEEEEASGAEAALAPKAAVPAAARAPGPWAATAPDEEEEEEEASGAPTSSAVPSGSTDTGPPARRLRVASIMITEHVYLDENAEEVQPPDRWQ